MTIDANTMVLELAARVSQALEAAGIRVVEHDDIPKLDTPWGPLRVITPTQSVMDRLAAFWHWNDRQSWDQAVMLARHQAVEFGELIHFAKSEGADPGDIEKLRRQAGR